MKNSSEGRDQGGGEKPPEVQPRSNAAAGSTPEDDSSRPRQSRDDRGSNSVSDYVALKEDVDQFREVQLGDLSLFLKVLPEMVGKSLREIVVREAIRQHVDLTDDFGVGVRLRTDTVREHLSLLETHLSGNEARQVQIFNPGTPLRGHLQHGDIVHAIIRGVTPDGLHLNINPEDPDGSQLKVKETSEVQTLIQEPDVAEDEEAVLLATIDKIVERIAANLTAIQDSMSRMESQLDEDEGGH